ncbi:S1 RNA-binding domain-containing protein [Oceanotoga sp. DSM 15011]|uniref:S1 RNA binding domain protein n=1 Tax=Oceanotoga teriensis TaxID=515440 RepID=A0AA45C637_9BACT|nr:MULTISPECIES: S1 RNA-binding domain-containing protein [Oceanotoga]MDN5341794.1 binding domain protein [Oceanotoga sp.]MDO7975707.1 S1 RNA-binding domain-containing protein [Oceanotoga teriensis]PWJ90545.1 S1 RNA binding domain protein [Oceanotoga teriensis]UYO99789.1 S1 RNA-binding domain-containing protein [Oceanotoga sp. DSM 15011]
MSESIAQGSFVNAKVVDIKKFGAFVEIESGEEGFIHISKVSKKYVKDVTDFLKVGQEITGKVIGKTKDGKYELSLREGDSKSTSDEGAANSENFEKKLTRFLKDSDRKISEYRKHLDKKRKSRRR